MVATLVFCGLELLFALNAWLAGASETQGAFAYLALGKLEPLPYPPSLVIQRNLMWLALAFLVGPAVLFRRFVRPALAAATLLLVGSVILDMALGAPTLKPEPSVGFSWDMLTRGLAGLGSLLALLSRLFVKGILKRLPDQPSKMRPGNKKSSSDGKRFL